MHLLGKFQANLRPILGISQAYLKHISCQYLTPYLRCISGISKVYIRHITGTIYKISDKSQAYLKYMLGISQSFLKYILGPAFFTLSQHILNTFKSQSLSPHSHVFYACLKNPKCDHPYCVDR